MKRLIKYIILSLLTFLSIYKQIDLVIDNNILLYVIYIVLFVLLFIFYKYLYKEEKLDKKYIVFIIIMSFILVLGYSYQVTSTSKLFFGSITNFIISIINIIGYYYFFKTLIHLFIKFSQKEYICNNKLINKFKDKPFLYSFIFLSICYGIFLVLYYPGIINYDNANQIKEVMGMHTRYLDAINPISNSTLTNFNPIIHTLLLGGLFKLGYIIGNVNFGMFLYTILQLIIVISIYSYAISYGIKQKVNPLYSFIILLILGIIPTFGYYSITLVKDTLYTAFLLLFTIRIYDFIKSKNVTKKDYIILFLTSLLVCLFRNNGIYLVIVTLPFLMFKNRKLPIFLVIITLLISYVSFNKVLLPTLGISGTSIRETLSIPFQQTARLVKLKESVIDNEDKEIIDKILDYDNLLNDYNEDLSDPVKNKYNKDASTKDLIEYFKVWFKYLLKEPIIYIDATINNITSYFNPYESSWKVYHKLNRKLPEAGFDYHYNKLSNGREVMHNYELFIEGSPLGLILNMGILTWFSILIFIMLINKNKNYIFMIPNIISILFCVLSPANTYYRYMYPTLVIIVCLFPLIMNNLKANKS